MPLNQEVNILIGCAVRWIKGKSSSLRTLRYPLISREIWDDIQIYLLSLRIFSTTFSKKNPKNQEFFEISKSDWKMILRTNLHYLSEDSPSEMWLIFCDLTTISFFFLKKYLQGRDVKSWAVILDSGNPCPAAPALRVGPSQGRKGVAGPVMRCGWPLG